MRINVYAEEITNEVEIVTKDVDDETFGHRTFYGVRFYLASPPELHDKGGDDDRSAITLWVPWTRAFGHDFAHVTKLLSHMSVELMAAASEADAASTADEATR